MKMIRRTYLILFLFIFLQGGLYSQNCSQSSYILTNQTDVGNLVAEGCTTISGTLDLNFGNTSVDISGLSNLTSVGGVLEIQDNTMLTNLDGLSNLLSVGVYVYISGNTMLTNLDGLQNLTSIGGNLEIDNNAALANVDGLQNLTSIGEYVDFESNGSLTNVDGLQHLTTVGDYLKIDGNDAITNIDGLRNLTSVGSDLDILDNISLTKFCGLFALLERRGVSGSYLVTGNSTNPTQMDIIDGGPCFPTAKPLPGMSSGILFSLSLLLIAMSVFLLQRGVSISIPKNQITNQ